MDWDADGTLDFISGSYDPGDVYLFRGLGRGKYAKGTTILDETGTPLVHHPEELKKFQRLEREAKPDDQESIQARVASFGSWPAPVDWDADGDLDVLIGSFSGEIFLRLNEGTRKEPVFAAESAHVVDEDGDPLLVSGHADPFPADWDGDGRWDLVVGAADGSVVWHRNVGEEAKPRFSLPQELVPAKSTSKFYTQYREPKEAPQPGARAQICVADWDGDGLLDLLVGDYSTIEPLRELGPKSRAAFDELARSDADLVARMLRTGPKSPEAAKLAEDREAIQESMKTFTGPPTDNRPPSSFVWLFLRIPGE